MLNTASDGLGVPTAVEEGLKAVGPAGALGGVLLAVTAPRGGRQRGAARHTFLYCPWLPTGTAHPSSLPGVSQPAPRGSGHTARPLQPLPPGSQSLQRALRKMRIFP